MLSRITEVMRAKAEKVVLRHKNSLEGTLYRPAVSDDAVHGNEVGGIGSLDAIEDSETDNVAKMCDVTFLVLGSEDEIGINKGLGIESNPLASSYALIVCNDANVVPTTHDLIVTEYAGIAGFVFEITKVISDVHLGGGTRRYELQYRDELAWFDDNYI